jgi:hypothetical protein
VYKGHPQAWEINLNPTIGRSSDRAVGSPKDAYRQLREPTRKLVNQQLVDALKRLEVMPTPPAIAIGISPILRRRLQVESRARARVVALRHMERVVVDSWPIRILKEATRPALRYIAPTVARLVRHHGSRQLARG